MRNAVKKTLIATLAAATFAAAVAGSATPAEAWGNHWGWGPAATFGVFGLATGAIIASQAAPYYGPNGCWVARPVHDAWGNVVGWRRYYVC